MSKPKRRLVSDALAAADEAPLTPSRDGVTTLQPEAPPQKKRSGIRHSYHASLYLPDEAQFALREIALMMRYPKPHDVMLEAMAELFEKYNKSELAAECRHRMSRDGVMK
jgi:hypothetical protein